MLVAPADSENDHNVVFVQFSMSPSRYLGTLLFINESQNPFCLLYKNPGSGGYLYGIVL